MTRADRDRRTIADARERLEPFGLAGTWSGRVIRVDDGPAEVEFVNRLRDKVIVSDCWTDDTGRILQCGSNAGCLVY